MKASNIHKGKDKNVTHISTQYPIENKCSKHPNTSYPYLTNILILLFD